MGESLAEEKAEVLRRVKVALDYLPDDSDAAYGTVRSLRRQLDMYLSDITYGDIRVVELAAAVGLFLPTHNRALTDTPGGDGLVVLRVVG